MKGQHGPVACRSVLRELGIADWWRVDVGEAGDVWLVAVDYRPDSKVSHRAEASRLAWPGARLPAASSWRALRRSSAPRPE